MTYQRRRGMQIKVWRTETQTDNRGNDHKVAVPASPHEIKAWVIPQRSSRAEVPGQQEIDVRRIGVNSDLEGVELWSTVEMDGDLWDVAAPPAKRRGSSRHVRHWSIDVRKRPQSG